MAEYDDPRDTVVDYQWVQHRSGDVYAVGVDDDGRVIQAQGPFNRSGAVTPRDYYPADIVYNTDDDLLDGAWLQAEIDAGKTVS